MSAGRSVRVHPAASGAAIGPTHRGAVAVRTDGLQKRFGSTEAVAGITFEIRQGEVFGLLGRNGAGKTTTISMLANLGKCRITACHPGSRTPMNSPIYQWQCACYRRTCSRTWKPVVPERASPSVRSGPAREPCAQSYVRLTHQPACRQLVHADRLAETQIRSLHGILSRLQRFAIAVRTS
jgi:energy-coupling factor transporter ATP-binding protein EcfA2